MLMTYYLFIQRKGQKAKLIAKGKEVPDSCLILDRNKPVKVGKYKTIIIYR